MRLRLPWPPSSNRYWRVYQGRILVSREARAYKAQLKTYAWHQKILPLAGPLSLTATFLPPDKRKRDGHNLTKILLDALEGVLYENDYQVLELTTRLHPGRVVTNGACYLKISPLTELTMDGWHDRSESSL